MTSGSRSSGYNHSFRRSGPLSLQRQRPPRRSRQRSRCARRVSSSTMCSTHPAFPGRSCLLVPPQRVKVSTRIDKRFSPIRTSRRYQFPWGIWRVPKEGDSRSRLGANFDLMKNPITYIQWIIFPVALLAWVAVGLFAWTISADEVDRTAHVIVTQDTENKGAVAARLHSIVQDTAAQRAQLASAPG